MPPFTLPSTHDSPIRVGEPQGFQATLEDGRVTAAFALWSRQAEQVLLQIARRQSHHLDVSSFTHRGKIISFKTLVSCPLSGLSKQPPRSLTVFCTRLCVVFKRLRKPLRVIETASLGVMCLKCYRNCIAPPQKEPLEMLLQAPASPDIAASAKTLLQRAFEQQCQRNRWERKRSQRAATDNQSKWLAKRRRRQVLPVASQTATLPLPCTTERASYAMPGPASMKPIKGGGTQFPSFASGIWSYHATCCC